MPDFKNNIAKLINAAQELESEVGKFRLFLSNLSKLPENLSQFARGQADSSQLSSDIKKTAEGVCGNFIAEFRKDNVIDIMEKAQAFFNTYDLWFNPQKETGN